MPSRSLFVSSFLNRIICPPCDHQRRLYFKCMKSCGYLCKQCKLNSKRLSNIYQCNSCFKSYCLHHFIHHSEGLVHYWRHNVGDLVIYNPQTQTKRIIHFSQNINQNASHISAEDKIFAIGGYDPVSNQVFEVDIINAALITKKSMFVNKYGMSLCCHLSYIYSIGGDNNSVAFQDCEKYSIHKDQWIQLPNLYEARSVCATFVFNRKYIYVYGGWTPGTVINTIERIEIKLSNKWESVNGIMAHRISCINGIQVDKSRAIIFGSEGSSSNAYWMTIKKKSVEFSSAPGLKYGASVSGCPNPVLVGNKIFVISGEKRIHIYSINKNTWNVLEDALSRPLN